MDGGGEQPSRSRISIHWAGRGVLVHQSSVPFLGAGSKLKAGRIYARHRSPSHTQPPFGPPLSSAGITFDPVAHTRSRSIPPIRTVPASGRRDGIEDEYAIRLRPNLIGSVATLKRKLFIATYCRRRGRKFAYYRAYVLQGDVSLLCLVG